MAVPDTSEKQPSYFGVYFYAVLTALFGALLGFFYLATFPAQAFSSQQEYEASIANLKESEEPVYSKPGDAYYIEGPVSRSRSWDSKRQQLTASGPQTVNLSASEINAWMMAKFRAVDPQKGDEESGIVISPGVPNVGLVDGLGLFVNLPVTIEAYGASGEYEVSVFGSIEPSGFKLGSFQVNSAKLPLPNIIGKQVMNLLASGYKATEEYKIITEALDRLQSASVEGEQLVITLR